MRFSNPLYLGMVSLLGMASLLVGQVPDDLESHITFHLSFDDSLEVDRAAGDVTLKQHKHEDCREGYSFVEGISGKALYNAGPRGGYRRYAMKDNLNFERPGSMTLWVKPLKWKPLTKDCPQFAKDRYNTMTTPFFSTMGKSTGYMVLERATPDQLGRPELIRLLFPCFKNVRSYYARDFVWKMGTWHFLTLTWSGSQFNLYVNGQEVLAVAHKRKLRMSEMAPLFEIKPSVGTVIDEFKIYDLALTPKTIQDIYQQQKTKQ